MTTTIILTNWTIRRSGAALTVTGRDGAGHEHKVTSVQQIYSGGSSIARPEGGGRAFGFGRDGAKASVRVELASGDQP